MKWYTLYARLAAAGVAIISMVVSFSHIAHTANSAGEEQWAAYLIAISLDGLIVVGIMSGIEDARHNRKWRKSGVFAFWTGIAGTLGANLASAEQHPKAWLVALIAPTAFLISAHVLHQSGKPKPTPEPGHKESSMPELDPESQDGLNRILAAASLARSPDITPKELSTEAGVSLKYARKVIAANQNGAAE